MGDADFRRFLEIALKIHQIFALVDVDYAKAFPAPSASGRNEKIAAHFAELAAQLSAHDGLNYAPREITKSGRVFEHAADSRVLIDHLSRLDDVDPAASVKAGEIAYYVKIVDEVLARDANGEDSPNIVDSKLADRYQARIQEELQIKPENVVL